MRESEKQRERDREIESDSSGSIPPTPFPCPQFFLELRVSGLSWFFVDRVAWRTSRCYGHHSSGWASVGPSLQGPPRQRKSIEIRTWGRALKAVPAKQKNNTKKLFITKKSLYDADISISFLISLPLRGVELLWSSYILCYPIADLLEDRVILNSLWWKSTAWSKKNKTEAISYYRTRPTLYHAPGHWLIPWQWGNVSSSFIFYLLLSCDNSSRFPML